MKNIVLIFFLVGFVQTISAQPFIDEIRNFQKQDSISFPKKGETLFVGSSSFRLWNDVQKHFPNHIIINRGFGGSSLEDVIRYAAQIIFPYEPKQVVIYCGENDIASGSSSEEVSARFARLSVMIREHLPKAKIIYVSIKPSPSRAKFQTSMMRANTLIKEQIMKLDHAAYVDVYTPMLTAEGKMRPELFLKDQLHMTDQGYAIWTRAILPVLE